MVRPGDGREQVAMCLIREGAASRAPPTAKSSALLLIAHYHGYRSTRLVSLAPTAGVRRGGALHKSIATITETE
jgi:hypothetical protein